LSTPQFLAFVNDKYSNPDGTHHYEITQTSGDTTVTIDIGSDNTSHGDATLVTNYEYEVSRQDTLRKIRLLDSTYVDQFVEEFENLIGASVL